MNILSVKRLTTKFFTDDGEARAVNDISFDIGKGETLCVVGESGCGKSVMAMSIMRLIQHPGRISSGEALFDVGGHSVDLLKISDSEIRKLRGKKMAMIFQEPMTSLNPVYTIGNQIAEALSLHEGLSGHALRDKVVDLLALVGIPAPEKRVDEYPHQLSGGMRQRAMIAMALSCNPELLIADEPTTALDVTIQAQILDLMRNLKEELGMALILVTHDLGVVAEMADRVHVMYAGQFVEKGSVDEIFNSPKHPYTQGLLNSIPPLGKGAVGVKLPTIPGMVPSLINMPRGCAFADRCPRAQSRCRAEDVPDDPCNTGRLVRCFYAS